MLVTNVNGKEPVEKVEFLQPTNQTVAEENETQTQSPSIYAGDTGSVQNGVSLTISEQAMKLLQHSIFEQEDEKEESPIEEVSKIMKIYRRVANGDQVPSSDLKKLMEYSMELYQAAMSAAMMNQDKDHKKYGSVYEDEEMNGDFREKLRALGKEENDSNVPDIVSDTDNVSVE